MPTSAVAPKVVKKQTNQSLSSSILLSPAVRWNHQGFRQFFFVQVKRKKQEKKHFLSVADLGLIFNFFHAVITIAITKHFLK